MAPSHGRLTAVPPLLAEATTTWTMLAGMAKPMPCEPPEREKIAVLMPTRLAGHVDQRAAGVAGIDRGVGLDEELVVGDADLGARQRRDDAVGHGLADAERIADRQHHVADLQLVGIAELEEREASRSASLTRITARSVRGSLSTTSASNSRLSASEILTWSAPSMTWLLVTTSPEHRR